MGSTNSNILPATTGLNLGSSNQKWNANLADAVADAFMSSTPDAAMTGNVRLSSPDFIAWRNTANTSDVTISKDFSDNILFSSGISAPSLEGTIYADQFSGVDIFDKANTAAATISGFGVVVIPPGSYIVSTTLICLPGVTFYLEGCHITYIGTSGSAISCISVTGSQIHGPAQILGTRSPNTTGLLLGNVISGGGLTTHNSFYNLTFGDYGSSIASNGFDVGLNITGNLNAGTYYNNFEGCSFNGNTSQGILINPILIGRANSNRLVSCSSMKNGKENCKIDGGDFNTFIGHDFEAPGTYNITLGVSIETNGNSFYGGDCEQAPTADVSFGPNATSNCLIGGQFASSIPSTGANLGAGTGNVFWPCGGPSNISYIGGTVIDLPVGALTTGNSAFALNIRDTENANANLIGIERGGVGSGDVSIGTRQYPLTIGGKVSRYNGVVTAGAGLPIIVGVADFVNQSAAITATNLYGGGSAGMYRVSYYVEVTQTGNAVNLALDIKFQDNSGAGLRTVTTANVACNGQNASTTAVGLGSVTFYTGASSPIQYDTTLSGAIGTGLYEGHLRVEYLG